MKYNGFSSHQLVLLTILCTNLALYFLYQYYTRIVVSIVKDRFSSTDDLTSIFNERCKLPQLDPFDPSIRQHLNPFLRNEKCNVTFTPKSQLKSGRLTVDIKDAECQYRCAEHVNDGEITLKEWESVNIGEDAIPQCDVVEVRCNQNGTVVYEHVHAQIFQRVTPKQGTPKYNVHILLLDSVSHSQYVRSMQLTRTFFNFDLDAIEFPYLSKVSLNSRPNAYAFLLNEPVDVYENKYGVSSAAGFKTELCNKPMDSYNYIGKHFNEAGYITLVNEDWQYGAFSWPNCVGFQRPYTNHSNKAYVQLTYGSKRFINQNISDNLYANSCKESHHHIFDHLSEYISKYEGIPKFSFTWMTTLAHSDGNALYRTDEDFFRFFKGIAEDLQDSFIFVMSDHGNRINPIRQTDIGKIEEMNPMLTMILPKALRNGNIASILRQNSNRLITHYDLYATWLDISQMSFSSYNNDFINTKFEFPSQKLLGNSLFHPISKRHSCFELEIPLEFCLCQYETEKFINDDVIIKAAKLVIDKINNDMWKNGLKDKCEELSLNEDTLEPAIAYRNLARLKSRIIKVKFNVLPGQGQYEGLIGLEPDNNISLITQEFPRIDSYESHAQCVQFSLYRQYCHCK